jgi:anti-sigma factor RsiW
MSLDYPCGDPAALATYLYDECEPAERRAIEAHLAICASCSDEIEALRATRAQLASWAPPDRALGFQIVGSPRTPASEPARVVTSVRWWQRPLPAWAQAAAALLIFMSGALTGLGVTRAPAQPGSEVATISAPPAVATPAVMVTPTDLTALEERLRNEFVRVRQAESAALRPVRVGASEEHLMQRVRELVAESEQRQQRELAFRTAQVVRDLDSQRQMDLARIERTVGQMEGTTGVEVRQQRQMLNYLIRVAQRPQ